MKLGRNTKMLIGLGILATYVLPLLAVFGGVVSLVVFISVVGSTANSQTGVELVFPLAFFVCALLSVIFTTFVVVAALLSSALRLFIYIHLLLNNTVSDMFRVLTAIGVFLLPFIAEPLYYYACIWRNTPPQWALPNQPAT